MKTIDTQEMKNKLEGQQDFVFLNVLSEEAFNEGHIPGSENIPQDDEAFVEKVAQRVPDKDAEIVVYCASRECPASENAARKLEEAGYSNVTDYEAGMQGWKEAEYEVAA